MFRAPTVIILMCLVSACASPGVRDSAKQTLLAADREWAAAAKGGKDVERIVSFWTDDAIVIPADAPVIRGKTAIRAYVQQSLAVPGFQISWRPDDASLSADGTMGYTAGENAVTVPGADGQLMTFKGRYVTVWRKTQDNAWKCVLDIWNSAHQ